MNEHIHATHSSKDRIERFKKLSSVLWAVLILNFLVSFGKIALGLATGLLSVFADGLHSFSDGASNILGLVGIHLARQPRDYDHPYGHRRYETLASLGIGFLLVTVSLHLMKNAYEILIHPRDPYVPPVGFAIMLVTMVINMAVMGYERKKADLLQSDLLRSDSMHTASDVLVTFSVIIGLVLIRMGWAWVDPVVTVLVSLIILRVAAHILKQGSDILCDHIVLDAKGVRELVNSVEGVKGCHMVRSRGRSDDAQVDLHVLVPDLTDVKTAHDMAHRVEEKIREKYIGVTDVVVHIEPESSLDEGHI